MKISIDVDCTPAEARAFLGLPDVGPLQEDMLAEVQRRLQAALAAVEPETLLKQWLPPGLPGMEQWQKMFWSQMAKAGGGKSGGPRSGKED